MRKFLIEFVVYMIAAGALGVTLGFLEPRLPLVFATLEPLLRPHLGDGWAHSVVEATIMVGLIVGTLLLAKFLFAICGLDRTSRSE